MWGPGQMEEGYLQFGLPVDCKGQVFSVDNGRKKNVDLHWGYLSNGTVTYSVWISDEWNREVFILFYRSNGTWSSSNWGIGRMEQAVIPCHLPVEFNSM